MHIHHNMWLFAAAVVCGVVTSVFGFIEPIPMPETLDECYKYRVQNLSITEVPSQDINMFCITRFLYSTSHLRPQRPISNETIAYAQELFRQLLTNYNPENGHRVKRQLSGVRQEIRTLSRPQWDLFTNRINMLKNLPVGNGMNRYDSIADIHRLVIASAHNGPNFLGWHRIYLLLLQIALGGVPIPYWDSRLDFRMDEPTDSVLWTSEFFGNGFGVVTEGPFGNWQTPGGSALIRNIGNDGTLINDDGFNAVLTRNFHREIVEPSNNPMFSLEGHHNGPHVWVDGQLSAPATAAQDPIFFLHHSFIDYFWSLFRRRQRSLGINSASDYPPTNNPLQQPFARMIPFNLRNINGYNDYFARLTFYAPSPTCPACGGSSYLECVGGACRSRVGVTPGGGGGMAMAASFAGRGAMGGMAPASVGGPERARATVMARGALNIGGRFQSAFRDPRTRQDTLPNAPVSRGKRSAAVTNTTASNSDANKDTSQINRPYQNTFVLNGVANTSLWAFVPVRIIFERPPDAQFESYLIQDGKVVKTSDMFSAGNHTGYTLQIRKKMPATYKKCHVSGSGASKVFVQTDGIDYSGRYKDYAVVDERLPISSSLTYVGVKNPTDGAAKFYMTAYDSCGRVCRPQCLIKGSYRPCSGAFRITSSFPKMYGITFEDAVKGIWKKGEGLGTESNGAGIPVTFLCEIQYSWPWLQANKQF
ncbi:tyrosinase-like protein 1 [Ylistrum balloti]|uniref:tyrosinase-like protein 1 n=1 Tax=Ylistrum balloti TaxID=509963 RepID=UPI002905E6DC|nr:tyrosinase-like protein 1 [Ylistrum balloti]